MEIMVTRKTIKNTFLRLISDDDEKGDTDAVASEQNGDSSQLLCPFSAHGQQHVVISIVSIKITRIH